MPSNFVGNLASGGSSGVYGQPGPPDDQRSLSLVNAIKDREKADFKDKANFMADLSNKQDRIRALFDPQQQQKQTNQQPINNQAAPPIRDPNAIGAVQKAQLGMGQQALDIKSSQEKLNQQKSDQIHQQKIDELTQKTNASSARVTQAQEALKQKGLDLDKTLAAHKELASAVEERHKLEMANKDAAFQRTSDQHQQTIDNLTEQLKQKGKPQTTTSTRSADGMTKTTTKGAAPDTTDVIGKDGKPYTIPADKVNDLDADGTPHWSVPGQDKTGQTPPAALAVQQTNNQSNSNSEGDDDDDE